MRVGIDITCWQNTRGFGRFTRELVTALVRLPSEHEYVLIADRQTADTADLPRACHIVVANTAHAVIVAAASDDRRSITDVLALTRTVGGQSLDVMYFPAVYSYFPIRRGLPCVVTLHDVIAESLPRLVFPSWRGKFYWHLKSHLAVRRADSLITVSLASKEGIVNRYKTPPERVSIISEAPAAVFLQLSEDRQQRAKVLQRYGVMNNTRFVLYVGGFSPHKNLKTLVSAFAELKCESAFNDVHLVMVGNWAKDAFHTCHESLSGQVEQLGLGSEIHFTGFVPDEELVHLYQACEAFVLPSFLEGFGLPVVEAMACGAAVIVSNTGSLPEVVQEAGELFDPHCVGSLVACLKRVLGDCAHQNDMKRRSRERAKNFSWDNSARQLNQILEAVSIGL